nr:hypothetical protein [uncultured Methanoregula sp.]
MPTFMLDTDALNYIGTHNTFFEQIISSVKSGEITLFVTHVQRNQVNAIRDSEAELRLKLQFFIQNYCNRVPTIGVICGISACGECGLSDGKDIMALIKNSKQIGEDALIAITAKNRFDYLVTNDKILRKRILKEFPGIVILKTDEFQEYISIK